MKKQITHRSKPVPCFRAAMQADGSLELLIYEDIGADWWTGNGVTAKTVKQEIDAAGVFSQITVRINSPGGDAFEGVAIFNLLRAQGKPIAVFVDGIAASAASIVAMAGDTRVMGSGAMLMIHNVWSTCVGYADDMRKMAEVLDSVSSSVAETYITRAGLTAEKAKELMDQESWLSAAAAVELGLATGIADQGTDDESSLALARSFKSLARLRAVPEILKAAEITCACNCAPCAAGQCDLCDCAGCDATNCANDACMCANNAQEASAAGLEIYEAELEAMKFALRV